MFVWLDELFGGWCARTCLQDCLETKFETIPPTRQKMPIVIVKCCVLNLERFVCVCSFVYLLIAPPMAKIPPVATDIRCIHCSVSGVTSQA